MRWCIGSKEVVNSLSTAVNFLSVIRLFAMNNPHDDWNKLQKNLAVKIENVFCNEREIWWCSLGMNIGTELFGKNELFERPVLVLKVYNKETIKILPLTSKAKKGKYYSPVILDNVMSNAVLSQARTISTKRLSRKVGRISEENFAEVKDKYRDSI